MRVLERGVTVEEMKPAVYVLLKKTYTTIWKKS